MESLAWIILVPALAVVLDSLLGDPVSLPHPVRFIGAGLDLYEKVARKLGLNLRILGWLAVLIFAVVSWTVVHALVSIPVLGLVFGLYFAFAGLALGCLLKDTRQVLQKLEANDLDGARQRLSMLVSRETATLDRNGIARSLAETISENLNDGFVAPLFYLTLFGPAGLWVYKTVSTMDSMWGYRTDQYIDLGRGAAKTDDLLAWIPARLTACLLFLAARGMGLDVATARARYRTDAVKMESPNAGWPMAAAAWLLKGTMGGPTRYFGKIKDKPLLGPAKCPWDNVKLRELLRLTRRAGNRAAWLFIPVFGLIYWVV